MNQDRSPTGSRGGKLHTGDISIDLNSGEVTAAGRLVNLTPTESRLLEVLLRQPGKRFTRAELVEAVMTDAIVLERTIDVHVRSLRIKLGTPGRRIEAIRGVGYGLRTEPQD